jgi:hypothetical protein
MVGRRGLVVSFAYLAELIDPPPSKIATSAPPAAIDAA